MASLARLRIPLTGGAVVGPSVMTLYATGSGSGFPAAVQTFLGAIKANFPASLTFDVPNGGDLITDTTGELTGSWTSGTALSIAGTGAGGFAIGTGLRIQWTTDGIVAGRRVKGSTFLVPAMSGSFETDGRVRSATITAIQGPLNSFVTAMAGSLVIWSRPVTADATRTPPRAARAGTNSQVVTGTLSPFPTQLRSRRT